MRYIFLIFALIFTACSLKTNTNEVLNQTNFEINSRSKHYAKLDFEQNLSLLPVSKEFFQNDDKTYKKYFFSAWHGDFKNLNSKNLFWSFEAYLNKNNKYYFFNKQIIPKSWFEKNIIKIL